MKRNLIRALIPAILVPALGMTISYAHADTLYKCTDKEGSVLFTNHRTSNKHCTVISRDSSAPSSGKPASNKPRASSTPTPGDFPKVSADTQKGRDNDRRTILGQELSNEQKNLEEARKSGDANRIQLHERNITALQKEIGNLK